MHLIKARRAKPIDNLNAAGYQLKVYREIDHIAMDWDEFMAGSDVFMSSSYFRALEKAPPEGMSFYYVTVSNNAGLQGVIYFQLHFFNAAKSLNYERSDDSERAGHFRHKIREFVAGQIQFYTLICGNAMITGEHGFRFDDSVPDTERINLIDIVADWLKAVSDDQGKEVKLFFVKDFYDKLFVDKEGCDMFPQYHEFNAQPSMQMEIPDEWEVFEDYMGALQSKYRVRVRKARKEGAAIECRELTVDEIDDLNKEIYSYYREIADNAVFNLYLLHPEYFSALKHELGDDLVLIGCFEDDELVGFYSMVRNSDQLAAHFLGYELAVNKRRKLYLNILLDIVEFAIREKTGSISFARTALEIKSSVGAVPRDMVFYLRHSTGFHNKLLPVYYNLLEPQEEWTPRSPFRGD